MFSGSADTKERIRESIDIVDVIGASIELRRQGRNFVGLCPWHQDSRPSLQVNQERQSWKCWVCDVGGDVFSFVMQREGFGFREALEMLAERAGITLERSPVNRAEPGSPNDKNTLYKAMAWAAKAYHRCLLEAADAAAGRKYLAERDIRETSIQQFQIGFVPNQWNWLVGQAERASFSPEVLESVGLAVKSERTGRWYDRFRGRIMFPICDTQRRPIAVGGRILPEFAEEKSAKYINSPETRLFSKSEQLYGLDLARDAVAKQNEVIVMEGYTDVVMARQSGIEHAVAVLGTALGQRHIPLLKRFTDRIALVLDGDTAGQRRANEILDLFIANQVDLRIVTLPDQLDPCDYVNQHGADAMLQTVATAPDAWEHKIQKEIGGVDLLRDTHGANRALETLIGTFAMTPTINQSGSSAQLLREQQILSRLAREFGLEEHQLRQRLAAARRQQAEKRAVRFDSAENSPKPATPKPRLEPMERDLFELVLMQPSEAANAFETITADQLMTPTGRQIHELMTHVMANGRDANCANLLLHVDDPAMQNLLVGLDEAGQEKKATDLPLALNELLQTFNRRKAERHLQQAQAALDRNDLDEDEQLELLMSMLQKKQQLSL